MLNDDKVHSCCVTLVMDAKIILEFITVLADIVMAEEVGDGLYDLV